MLFVPFDSMKRRHLSLHEYKYIRRYVLVSMLLKYQLRERREKIIANWKKKGGKQKMKPAEQMFSEGYNIQIFSSFYFGPGSQTAKIRKQTFPRVSTNLSVYTFIPTRRENIT